MSAIADTVPTGSSELHTSIDVFAVGLNQVPVTPIPLTWVQGFADWWQGDYLIAAVDGILQVFACNEPVSAVASFRFALLGHCLSAADLRVALLHDCQLLLQEAYDCESVTPYEG